MIDVLLLRRFGIGRFTTEEEIDYTVAKTITHVKRLREMRLVTLCAREVTTSVSVINKRVVCVITRQQCISLFCSPLWEMVQEGVDLKTIQWSQH